MRIGRPADKRVFQPRFRVARCAGTPAGGEACHDRNNTKAPGPLPPIELIARDAFRFDDEARRELVGLLPVRLQQLRVPENIKQGVAELPDAPKLETLAELIVALTEDSVKSYFTACGLNGGTPTNPANVRAAIGKLRAALKPLVAGQVDDETADIIPEDLAVRLADRERELAGMRLPPAKRRNLALLCQWIGVVLKQYASANEVAFEERDAIRYVATALDYAGIEHSYSTENPARFVALVFPKS
jgi:hypothetical protein